MIKDRSGRYEIKKSCYESSIAKRCLTNAGLLNMNGEVA